MNIEVSEKLESLRDSIFAATEKKFCTKSRLNKLAKELDLIAFSDLTNYLILGEDGSVSWVDPEGLKKSGLTRAIKKIKRRKIYKAGKGEDDETIITDEVDFELHSKMEAIQTLVEIMGIKSPEKLEHDISGSLMAAVAAHLSGNNDPKTKD